MPLRDVWSTREELVAEIGRLECEAGLQPTWSRPRWSPSERFGYADWRAALRRAYFSVSSHDLSRLLISYAIELDRRDRVEADHLRSVERHELARARSNAGLLNCLLAFSIGAGLLTACAAFSGILAMFAGLLPAILLTLGSWRDSFRRDRTAIAKARGALSLAERRCNELEARAVPFLEQEALTGVPSADAENMVMPRLEQRPAKPRISRDWVRPIDFVVAAA